MHILVEFLYVGTRGGGGGWAVLGGSAGALIRSAPVPCLGDGCYINFIFFNLNGRMFFAYSQSVQLDILLDAGTRSTNQRLRVLSKYI